MIQTSRGTTTVMSSSNSRVLIWDRTSSQTWWTNNSSSGHRCNSSSSIHGSSNKLTTTRTTSSTWIPKTKTRCRWIIKTWIRTNGKIHRWIEIIIKWTLIRMILTITTRYRDSPSKISKTGTSTHRIRHQLVRWTVQTRTLIKAMMIWGHGETTHSERQQTSKSKMKKKRWVLRHQSSIHSLDRLINSNQMNLL